MKNKNDTSDAYLKGRYWPTLERRPGESIREWCDRIDSYQPKGS